MWFVALEIGDIQRMGISEFCPEGLVLGCDDGEL